MIHRFVHGFSLPALLLLGSLLSASAGASSATGECRFRVFLDDAEIGYHNFRLLGQGPEQKLESEARYNVKFLPRLRPHRPPRSRHAHVRWRRRA